MYEIKADTSKNRLLLKIIGMLKPNEIEPYTQAMKSAVGKLKPGFNALLDFRETEVFDQKLLEDLQKTKEIATNAGLNKSALIVSSVILKMQFNRNFSKIGPQDKAFNTIEEAEKYLEEK